MDKRTQHTLGRITRGIPRHLAEHITKEVVDTSEEDLARSALRDPEISPAKKEQLRAMIDSGAFRRSEVVVDEDVARKVDQYHEREIARARRAGTLEEPGKNDPFIQKRLARMRKMGK